MWLWLMASALIKIDSRSRATFFDFLKLQQQKRQEFGEVSFSLNCDDDKRHICYVILNWVTFTDLNKFLDSKSSNEIFNEWPVEEIIEVVRLRQIGDKFET